MIKDKVAIITGASSGIGEATAKLLASKGAKLVLGARRGEELKQIVEEIKADGGQAVYQELDVTDPSANEAIVELAKNECGGVQEPDETHHDVQEARVQRAHVEGPHGGLLPGRGVAGLDHDRADEGGVEPEDDAQVRPLLGRPGDPGRGGQRGGGDEVAVGVVAVAIVAQQDLFGALRDHAKGG